jgi:hypothetical protein
MALLHERGFELEPVAQPSPQMGTICVASALSPKSSPQSAESAIYSRRSAVREGSPGKRLAESRVQRLPIGLADSPGPPREQLNEVPRDRALNACAGTADADVAVALVGQQHRMAQPPRRDNRVSVGGIGIVRGADHQDRFLV